MIRFLLDSLVASGLMADQYPCRGPMFRSMEDATTAARRHVVELDTPAMTDVYLCADGPHWHYRVVAK